MTFQIQRYEKNVFEFRFEFPILNLNGKLILLQMCKHGLSALCYKMNY